MKNILNKTVSIIRTITFANTIEHLSFKYLLTKKEKQCLYNKKVCYWLSFLPAIYILFFWAGRVAVINSPYYKYYMYMDITLALFSFIILAIGGYYLHKATKELKTLNSEKNKQNSQNTLHSNTISGYFGSVESVNEFFKQHFNPSSEDEKEKQA